MASKKEKLHVIDADNGGAYAMQLNDRDAVVLCGAALWYREKTRDGRGTITKRLGTVSIVNAMSDRPGERRGNFTKKCPACFKLARMNPDERREWRKAKADAFAKLAEHGKAKKAAELAALDAAIDKARGDALAVLDAWHLGDGLPKRCASSIHDDTGERIDRCCLAVDAWGQHRGQKCTTHDASGNPLEPALDASETFNMAIKAYKREHGGDAGQRLWMFKRFDDDDNAPAKTKREKIGEHKRVVCRFCQHALGYGKVGEDFTRHTFVYDSASKIAGLGLGAASIDGKFQIWIPVDGVRIDIKGLLRVSVAEHTQLCALKYLGQVKPSVDPEIQAPSDLAKLPGESFVLTMDEESEQP